MKKICFNEGWSFSLNGEAMGLVNIPHDYSIDQPRSADAPACAHGGFFKGGIGRYEKYFSPKKNKKYFFMCDGSFGITEVFINENLVYINKYGYNSFYADLTDYLRYGVENKITVRVNNTSLPNARWYTGSGIYRDVFLCECDSAYLHPFGPYVYTEHILDGVAYLNSDISFFSYKNGEGVLKYEIFKDGSRDCILSFKRSFYAEVGLNKASARFKIDSPMLWDMDNPRLYKIRVSLEFDGNKDTESAVFGIRTVIADSDKGLLLNGKSIKLRGGCIHHDGGPVGAKAYKETDYRRIAKLKAAGFNAIRLSHNPQSQHLYDACDRLGMLVIDELFDYWTDGKQVCDMHTYFEDNYLNWTDLIVLRNRCHPSIVMWSTGNEIPQKTGRGYGYRIARNIADRIRENDKSRLLTHGLCVFFTHKEDFDRERAEEHLPPDVMDFFADRIRYIGDTVDILGYNYLEHRIEKDLVRFPTKLIMSTETYPLSAYKTAKQWQNNDRILGDFVWTAWDYFGETGIGHINYHYPEPTDLLADRYPNHISNCGDFNIIGERKPQSYLREIAWGLRKEPYIACTHPKRMGRPYSPSAWGFYDCEHSWSFSGCEGMNTAIYVFADCDEVILTVNGNEIGRQPKTDNGIYIFETVYEPGEICATAVADGKIIGTHTVKTEGDVAEISLSVEKSYIPSKLKGDVIYIDASALDENGNICTMCDALVEYEACGAEIIGIASGDLLEEAVYTESSRKLYRGRSVVVLKKHENKATLSAKMQNAQIAHIVI